jgi:hypothetical protein
VEIAPDPPRRLASATSSRSSRKHAPQLQTSAHAGCVPPLSSEVSACAPSSGAEPTPPTRLGSPSLSAQSPPIPSATITKSSVKSAPSNTSVQEPRWPPRRILSSANQARLGELVDELDKWLNTKTTEPTDTLFHFLKALDVKVRASLNATRRMLTFLETRTRLEELLLQESTDGQRPITCQGS